MEEHKERLRLVLQTLREHQLYAKFSKCEFFKEQIQYLGHIITKEAIVVDPKKIRTIMEWPVPKDVADIRSFMGLADHHSLTKYFSQPTLNVRQAQWVDFLSGFDFEIKHLKGKENRVADALSRKLQCLYEISCSKGKNTFEGMIKKATEKDITYHQIKQQVQHSTSKENQQGYAVDVVGILYYKKRLYVPNQNIKNLILDEFHKSHYAGHPGYQKMITALQKEYYWLGMKKDVVNYLARCLECQQIKVEHQHPVGLLQPLPIPEWKWETISMDFITDLLRQGKITTPSWWC
eukprot:PITA_07180